MTNIKSNTRSETGHANGHPLKGCFHNPCTEGCCSSIHNKSPATQANDQPVAPKPPPDPPIAPWVVNQNPLWSIGWVCFSYLVGSLAKRTNINISLWSLYHPGWGVCWICPTTIELDREQTHTVFAIQCFVEKELMYFILKAPINILPSRGIVVMVDFSAHRPSNYNEVR